MVLLFTIHFGCTQKYQKEKKMKRYIAECIEYWHGRILEIPDSLNFIKDNEIVLLNKNNFCNQSKKMITVIDGSCHLCIEELRNWESLFESIDEPDLIHPIYFLIEDIEPTYFLKMYYPETDKKFNYILDPRKIFSNRNKIPNVNALKTFLVDSACKVYVIGSPFINDKTKRFYLKELTN